MIHALGPLTTPSLALTKPDAVGAGDAATPAGGDFLSVLGKVAADTVGSVKDAEAASAAGLKGEMPVQKVVNSIMTAERELQTVLNIRDKAIAAYQEIGRMAI